VYEREFKANNLHGKAIYIWYNGNTYDGQWKFIEKIEWYCYLDRWKKI
jgi:hypothetical protein